MKKLTSLHEHLILRKEVSRYVANVCVHYRLARKICRSIFTSGCKLIAEGFLVVFIILSVSSLMRPSQFYQPWTLLSLCHSPFHNFQKSLLTIVNPNLLMFIENWSQCVLLWSSYVDLFIHLTDVYWVLT